MKKTIGKKLLVFIICALLTAATAVIASGCEKSENTSSGETLIFKDGDLIGEGKTSFNLEILDEQGKKTTLTVNTDKKLVGEALEELRVVAGDEGTYGLYIKTVNGITVDYNKDGEYWAFYVGDKYAPTGIDQTEIVAGATYGLRVE